MKTLALSIILGSLIFASPVAAQKLVNTQKETATIEQCNSRIRTVAQQLAAAPTNIIETTTMRVVKWATKDGSVIVSCDGGSKSMTTQQFKN